MSELSIPHLLAWSEYETGYARFIDDSWWQQIPQGAQLNQLLQSPHSVKSLSQHVTRLFKVQSLGEPTQISPELVYLAYECKINWMSVAQILGFMVISVPYGNEIDGKEKQKFLERLGGEDGEYAQCIYQFAAHEKLKIFYKALTFRKLRLLNQQPLESILQEASLSAWALLSLALPKGLSQRIHLSLPADWVSEIQNSRKRFAQSEEAVKGIRELSPWIIQQINTLHNKIH